MKLFGSCWLASEPFVPASSWIALRQMGCNAMRFGGSPDCPEPDPQTWKWDRVLKNVADIRAAGLLIYWNPPGFIPLWAMRNIDGSEVDPRSIDPQPLNNTLWWNRPHALRPAKPTDPAWNIHEGMVLDPFPHGVHEVFQPSVTGEHRPTPIHDDLTGEEIPAEELDAIDEAIPPRPWLKQLRESPPLILQSFAHDLGAESMRLFGAEVCASGWGNEPGANNGAMRFDAIAFPDDGGKLGDVVKTRLMPNEVVPFTLGVRSVLPNMPTIACEADGDGILSRYCDAEVAGLFAAGAAGAVPVSLFTYALSAHPYGDVRGNMDYATTSAFNAVFDRYGHGRQRWNGELACSPAQSPQILLDWLHAHLNDYDAHFFLGGGMSMFFEEGTWSSGTPVLHEVGRGFKDLFSAAQPTMPGRRPGQGRR
jgi:hypothetical protein